MNAVLLGIALAVAAPALKEKVEPDIVGEWVAESIQSTGRTRPPSSGELRYVFAADGKWTVYRGEFRIGSGSRGYNTDPKKSPATIDLISDTTEQEPSVSHGIYKIEGDRLTLCVSRGRSSRPTRFEVSEESPGALYVFKRAKKKD
jgi:uncharacterized protein (TIGR03067 family)